MTGKTDKQTIAVYDAQAETYKKAFADHEELASLHRFIEHLPKAAQVLDFGCGPGHHSATLHRSGLIVTAMDASAEMVGLARQHEGVDVQQATFDDLHVQAIYDGIWAHFSLLHAPRADFLRHLEQIAKALKPNGIFHIGLKTGDGERRDHLGRYYTYYKVEELRVFLADAGFVIINETLGQGAGLAGTVDPWVEILARKN